MKKGIDLTYFPMEEKKKNILTKPLGKNTFEEFTLAIGVMVNELTIKRGYYNNEQPPNECPSPTCE